MGCLEYVADTELPVGELTRVTKPGGFVLASFANRRSPRRWWDELVVHPIARSKRAIAGGAGASYARRLHGPLSVERLFEASGATISELHYLNPGVLGYPLSELATTVRAQQRLARRVPRLRRTALKLLVVARVPARPR